MLTVARRFLSAHETPQIAQAFSLLSTRHFLQSAKTAGVGFGMYGTGDVESDAGWVKYTTQLRSDLNITTEPLDSIIAILGTLANHNVCIGTFWTKIFQDIDQKISLEKVKLSDIIELVQVCNKVDYRSSMAISKLLGMLLDNETVWTLNPSDLASATTVVANSMTQNRLLFSEIGNRVCLEIDDFTNPDLISIMVSFSKVNLMNSEMFSALLRRLIDEDLSLDDRVLVGHVLSSVRFRSDTFFKHLCSDLITSPGGVSPGVFASVGMSMKRLKMDSGNTQWWSKEDDFKSLVDRVSTNLVPSQIERMNAKELANCIQLIGGKNLRMRTCNAVMERMQYLLTKDPLGRSHIHLASLMEGFARGVSSEKEIGVHVDHTRWVAEWLCGNVYVLPVHDVVSINRAIAKLGFKDHNYHKIWIPYYLERLDTLVKDDITLISDNYNAIGMSDTLMGGRHFFYKLGKRFQELTVEANGDKEVNTQKKYRNLLRRLG